MGKLLKVIQNPKKIIDFLAYHKWFNWLPDKPYLKLMYWTYLGKKLNLDNPKTFNEKLQWLKLNERKDIYTTMVDKYEVKNYVAERIGEQYIIPTLGVWDNFDDIDFDSLPNQFVLKCTHDSGGLVICRDKSEFDIKKAKKKINRCLKTNYYKPCREWPYKNVKPRIIAEEYMQDGYKTSLTDYKFYCFNGEVKYLYISEGLEDHATAKISFLTPEWKFAPFKRSDYAPFEELPKKPVNFQKMLELANLLSKTMSFIRIDLYEINKKIYFSEYTLFPTGGFMPFEPNKWDEELGNWINLPTSRGGK